MGAGAPPGMSWPSYLRLGTDELAARARQALALLGQERCGVCPRLCKVNRLADHKGLCAIGRQAVVAACFPHFGEENSLRGGNGSGTIFFSGCNLRGVFCQNHDISWHVHGERVTPARLAQMMLALQARGCHNINWVTPEHVVPQILEAVPLAVAGGAAVADHLQHQRLRRPGQPAAHGRHRRYLHARLQGLEPADGPPLPTPPRLCGSGQGGGHGDAPAGRPAGGRLRRAGASGAAVAPLPPTPRPERSPHGSIRPLLRLDDAVAWSAGPGGA